VDAFRRALAVMEASYGPIHTDLSYARDGLGLVLKDMGELVAAREEFERAVAIAEAVYGPDHPLLARRREHLDEVVGILEDPR
jgi:hypothetical protein